MGRSHDLFHKVTCEWCGFENNPDEIKKEWDRRDPHYSMSYPCESCGGTLSAKQRPSGYFTLRYDGKSRRRRLIQAGSTLLRLPIPKQYRDETNF
jgi:hypothetical protein